MGAFSTKSDIEIEIDHDSFRLSPIQRRSIAVVITERSNSKGDCKITVWAKSYRTLINISENINLTIEQKPFSILEFPYYLIPLIGFSIVFDAVVMILVTKFYKKRRKQKGGDGIGTQEMVVVTELPYDGQI